MKKPPHCAGSVKPPTQFSFVQGATAGARVGACRTCGQTAPLRRSDGRMTVHRGAA